jgi:hypothetical protein
MRDDQRQLHEKIAELAEQLSTTKQGKDNKSQG